MRLHLRARLPAAAIALGVLVGCTGESEPGPDRTGPAPGTRADVDEGAFCDAFTRLSRSAQEAVSAEQGAAEIETMSANAPAELADDVLVIDTGFRALARAITDAGFDLSVLDDDTGLTAEQMQKIRADAAANGFDAVGSESAFENVEAWATSNCAGFVPQPEPGQPTTEQTGSLQEFCDAYQQLSGNIRTTASLPHFDALVANAPAEISAAVVTVQTSVLTYITALEAAGYDAAALDDLSSLPAHERDAVSRVLEDAGVDTAAYQMAGEEIQAFGRASC